LHGWHGPRVAKRNAKAPVALGARMGLFSRKAKDPVCGMDVDPKTAAATETYKGKTYHFCSRACRSAFQGDPERYLS